MAEDPNGSEMAEKVVALKVQASRRLSSPGVKAEGGEAKIKLANLPAHVSKMLASMDSDGDGTLDWQEIFAGAQAHTEAVSKSKFFSKLFVILFCLWLTQLACMFGVVFGVVLYAKDSARLTPQDPVLRVKGTSTPVQCASTDLTVDPLTGHLLLRDTTPSGVTINVEIGASDVPVAATPSPGRKLLAGDSQPAGRSLLQTPTSTSSPVLAMNTICGWHTPDFWNQATGTYLTGTCSQFQYSRTMSIPMLSNQGQNMGHYHLSTVTNIVQQITYVSFPAMVPTAFCQWDMYRVSFSSTSWLDFCFVPLTPAQCPTNNCPTTPFVNYANFAYDTNLLDLPCVLNVRGQIKSGLSGATNNACIHMIGEFGKSTGDPKYRLSAQLPIYNGAYNVPASKVWYPNGTTTTDSANGAFPSGRHLLSGRSLLGKYTGGGSQ